MSTRDDLTAFDGFTRRAARAGMFNGDQLDHMRHLSSLPAEAKCPCGWDLAGACYTCNDRAFRRLGIAPVREYRTLSSCDRNYLDYRLPNGCRTGYAGAVAWVHRNDKPKEAT